jgi:protein-tyrosine phosphatase
MAPSATLILPSLYLGSDVEARNLKYLQSLGITHIVNCAYELKSYHPSKFKYLELKMLDDDVQDVKFVFSKALEFIHSALISGNKVFVHCFAGVSRSVSLIIYYLMMVRRMPFKTAYAYVKAKRSIIDPGTGFKKQLEALNVIKMRPSRRRY